MNKLIESRNFTWWLVKVELVSQPKGRIIITGKVSLKAITIQAISNAFLCWHTVVDEPTHQ